MHDLLKVIRPSRLEMFFYIFVSFLLMTALVGQDLWQQLLTSTHTDQQTFDTISLSFKESVNHLTRLSDPQIINAVVWGATAAIALCIVGGIVHFVQVTEEDAAVLKTGGSEMNFWAKLLLRIGAGIALVVFVVFCAAVIVPATLLVYESRLAHPLHHWSNLPLVVGAVLATAACLYLCAVFCRLIALKIRVFSDSYE